MKKFLFNLKWRFVRPQAFKAEARALSCERLSPCELMVQQEKACQELVRYAMRHTTFYQDFYRRAGFRIEDIGQAGWFERLPILTKADIREHFKEMTSVGLQAYCHVSTTGGSMGTPVKTGYDGRLPEEIYAWRVQRWFGVKPWEDHAYIWRETRTSKLSRVKNALMWWPTKHLKLDASFMSSTSIRAFVDDFNRLRPTMLQGYVGAVTQVADFIERNGLVVWHPKLVWVTSAPLSDVQRTLLTRVFKGAVCNQYGSCEVRWIAQSCSCGSGLHVNTDHVRIEFVDDMNRPIPKGEYGKTLLTNLEDYVFPIIRYENGDRGRWLKENCPCGCTFPLIDSVKGRESESFVLPSGKIINGEYLTTIFDATPDLVRGFRVVQHKDASITIEYIPSGVEADILTVLKTFATKLGGEVPVEFKRVSIIPHDRGKLRFIVKEH